MLIVYLQPLTAGHIHTLTEWHTQVRYWPRSWSQQDQYHAAVATDWWLLFTHSSTADLWLMRWPEHSRIVRTLLD